jgi:stage III sporulation protein AG
MDGSGKRAKLSWCNLSLPWLRKTHRLIILVLLGVALLLVSKISLAPQDVYEQNVAPRMAAETGSSNYEIPLLAMEESYARRLERLLSGVLGAGQVAVAVTLEQGPQHQYLLNEDQTERITQEQDANGGTRTVSEVTVSADLALVRNGGGEQPAQVGLTAPAVRGVLVVAEGAADSRVKAALNDAVHTALNVPVNRITVLAGKVGSGDDRG